MTMHVQINISADENGHFTPRDRAVLEALNGKPGPYIHVSTANPETAAEQAKTATEGLAAELGETSKDEPVEEKPKRKRRTKDEIEADKRAAEEAKAVEEAATEEPEEDAPEDEADAPTLQEELAADDEADAEEAAAAAGHTDGAPTKEDAAARATQLIAERKVPLVKEALAAVGVKRVGELTDDQVVTFMAKLDELVG